MGRLRRRDEGIEALRGEGVGPVFSERRYPRYKALSKDEAFLARTRRDMNRSVPVPELTPDLLEEAYRKGYFPMAYPELGGSIYWHAPDPRALLPIQGIHYSADLLRRVRRRPFRVTTDEAFREVMVRCADRPSTWISGPMIEAYSELHERGRAHSVESWQDGKLVGGLYGVAIGAAFFGESMFYEVSDASKVALVHLAAMLREVDFSVHDIQYLNAHTERFGAHEIPRSEFLHRLERARDRSVRWPEPPDLPPVARPSDG